MPTILPSRINVNSLARAILRAIEQRPAGLRVTNVEQTYQTADMITQITLSINIADSAMYDIMTDVREAIEIDMDEEEPTPVARPTTHSITVAGTNNLQVRWEKEAGFFRLESVCVVCGRRFEKTLRGFVTKELVTMAHELGFSLGEHLERHQSFGDYLRKLQTEDNRD